MKFCRGNIENPSNFRDRTRTTEKRDELIENSVEDPSNLRDRTRTPEKKDELDKILSSSNFRDRTRTTEKKDELYHRKFCRRKAEEPSNFRYRN